MSWGDVPAWAALLVATGAAWVAWLARKDSQKSAEASVRSAEAAEGALILQQRELDERREAARPRPELQLERERSNAYRLRNVGTATAEGVRVLPDGLPAIARGLPEGVTLIPGSGHRFMMAGSWGPGILPTHVMVTWDGLTEPVALPLPEYP